MRNKFTLSSSIKRTGDSVVLFKDKYVKHSYLYVDPKCEFRANNPGFTRENTGVILEDYLGEDGIPHSHKIMVNNGNTGWIPSEYLEVVQSSQRKGYTGIMEYRNIRVGQKLLLRGQLHGAYEAEVVQVDPRRITHAGYRQPVIGDPVQVKVVLYPGDEPSLLWVNPDRLMDSDR